MNFAALGSLFSSILERGIYLHRWWLMLILIAPGLFALRHQDRLGRWRVVLLGSLVAFTLLFGLNLVILMRLNIQRVPEWDFLAFWLHGQIAAQGANLYDPSNYERLAQPFHPGEEFVMEVVKPGFVYPPQTIWLMLPLGWFEIHKAYLFWYVINGLALAADIWLLWKLFLRESGIAGLLGSAFAVLLIPATMYTIQVGQTNFLVLLCLLLLWRDRERPRAGLWLALGLVVKPLFALYCLYPLLRRQGRTLAVLSGSLFVIAGLTVAKFGLASCLGYFTDNPASRLPGYLYKDLTNQSLLATILRFTGKDYVGHSPVMDPVFLAIAAVLVGITGWCIVRRSQSSSEWPLALLVCMVLLVYPATLSHYSVVLIVPILLLCAQRYDLPGAGWWPPLLAGIEFALLARGGACIFLANAIAWGMILMAIVWQQERASAEFLPRWVPQRRDSPG